MDKNTDVGQEVKPVVAEEKPVEAPPEWKQEFTKVIAQRDSFKKKVAEVEAKVHQYEAEKAAHEADLVARREAAENAKMAEAGQYQELLAKKDKQRETEVQGLKQRVSQTILPLWIRAASSEISNLTPEAHKDLPSLLKEYIRVDENGNAQVQINGLPKLDDNGKPVDPISFIKEFVSERKYMILDGMPKSHGGNNGAGGKVSEGAKTIEVMMENRDNKALGEWQAKDPTGFTSALNEYTLSLGKKARAYKK